MEDSKLLTLARWLGVILLVSTILCVILTLIMPFMDTNFKLEKTPHWVAAFTVVLAVGLLTLRFFIRNDHDLQQPKQKKSEAEQDEDDIDDAPESDGTVPAPRPANPAGGTGNGRPTPTDRQQISNRMLINVMDNTRQRLLLEIKYQKNTSYFNLLVSIVLSVVALSVMWLYAFDTKAVTSGASPTTANVITWLDFAYVAIPKFGLALFIELVALSFYKTYKTNLDNIKYYQNELTSIESRRIALYAAIIKDNDDNIKLCVDTLLKIDRNFKLSDGESTIELEKLKLDYSYLSKVIKSFKGVINIKEE